MRIKTEHLQLLRAKKQLAQTRAVLRRLVAVCGHGRLRGPALQEARRLLKWAPAHQDEERRAHVLRVTDTELHLLIDGLDAHKYWDLADDIYKDSGYVLPPGTDDPDKHAEMQATELLEEYLETRVGEDTPGRSLEREIEQVKDEEDDHEETAHE